jgi:hypothetical protein
MFLVHIGEKKYKFELDAKTTHEGFINLIKNKFSLEVGFELQFHDPDFDEWVNFQNLSEIPSSLRVVKIKVIEKATGRI